MMQLYNVKVELFNNTVLEQNVAATDVFAAVKFAQDECAKNAWRPKALQVGIADEGDIAQTALPLGSLQ